jgi:hypothetical protein
VETCILLHRRTSLTADVFICLLQFLRSVFYINLILIINFSKIKINVLDDEFDVSALPLVQA